MNGRLVFHSGSDLSLDGWSAPPPANTNGVILTGIGSLSVFYDGGNYYPRFLYRDEPYDAVLLNNFSVPVYFVYPWKLEDEPFYAGLGHVIWRPSSSHSWRLVAFGGSFISPLGRDNMINAILQYGSNAIYYNPPTLVDDPDNWSIRDAAIASSNAIFGLYVVYGYASLDSRSVGHGISSLIVSPMPDGSIASSGPDEYLADEYEIPAEYTADPPDPLPDSLPEGGESDSDLNPDEGGEGDPPEDP